MKTPVNIRAPSRDAHAITETIRTKLAAAGLDASRGPMLGVSEIIRRALCSASTQQAQRVAGTGGKLIKVAECDGVRRNAEPPRRSMLESKAPFGTFESHQYANQAGARAYKLYVPARIAAAPPLVVMLHGCTQSADDFATGTGMNQLADEHGFLVAYPEQAASANPSKCWNWFKARDQVRDGGEPSLIVGIVRVVAAQYRVDPRRIFVAGMSAGAAMAVILGETYPELFASVGAHSGLPYRSAKDIPSAMQAMKGGSSKMPGLKTKRSTEASPFTLLAEQAARQTTLAEQATRETSAKHAVPLIVFHGDQDHTVQHSNAIEIVRQAKNALTESEADLALNVSTQRGTCESGRSYTQICYADATGVIRIESWTVHGVGHAWSGGNADGSYTEVSGPDASAQMVRFFLSRP